VGGVVDADCVRDTSRCFISIGICYVKKRRRALAEYFLSAGGVKGWAAPERFENAPRETPDLTRD
jgi:hypothetical protein